MFDFTQTRFFYGILSRFRLLHFMQSSCTFLPCCHHPLQWGWCGRIQALQYSHIPHSAPCLSPIRFAARLSVCI